MFVCSSQCMFATSDCVSEKSHTPDRFRLQFYQILSAVLIIHHSGACQDYDESLNKLSFDLAVVS